MPGDSEIEIRQIFEAADFGEVFTPEMQQAEERTAAQNGREREALAPGRDSARDEKEKSGEQEGAGDQTCVNQAILPPGAPRGFGIRNPSEGNHRV
jgi:hypothetical protein